MEHPKHILFLFTDQQRGDTIAALGNSYIKTPALDSLARDSIAFTRCLTPSPVCVPARNCLVCGKYPNRTGCVDNGTGRTPEDTLFARLTRAGYRTCAIGKMHFASEEYGLHGLQERRTQEEFYDDRDDYAQFLKHSDYRHVIDYNGVRSEMYYIPQISPLPAAMHPTQWIGDQSVDFIEHCDPKRPNFLMASFIHPHPPFAPPAPWNKLYRGDPPAPLTPEDSADLITYFNVMQNRYKGLSVGIDQHLVDLLKNYYYACVSFVDYQVGRIIGALKARGMYEDTMIIFTSDHGELLGDYNCLGKRTMLDSGARVPLLIHRPGMRAVLRTDPASLIDIEPTLLHWAGQEWGADEFDGLDLFQNRHALVYSQLFSGDSGLYMAASDHDKLIYSRADDKFYYFDAFPETKNRYDPSGSACRILRGTIGELYCRRLLGAEHL